MVTEVEVVWETTMSFDEMAYIETVYIPDGRPARTRSAV